LKQIEDTNKIEHAVLEGTPVRREEIEKKLIDAKDSL